MPCETATVASIAVMAMLQNGRYSPVGEPLPDGRALFAGGWDFVYGAIATAEAFDPATNALDPLPCMYFARNFAASARLQDTTILIAGGFDATGSVRSAELYDPSVSNFVSLTAQLGVPREAHTATTLADGSVLVAGGLSAVGFVFHRTGEIYDPTMQSFAPVAAPMTSPRAYHAAVWLPERGAVLLVGGDSGHGELASAERFDVATSTFVATANGRAHAGKAVAAVRLRDGRVLITGGSNATNGTLVDADIYDPATDMIAPTAPMQTRRMAHTLTLLGDGRVLAVGGWSDSTTPSASAAPLEVYDPTTATWQTLPVRLAVPRHDHRVVLLPDCRAVIGGGQHVVGSSAPTAPLEVEVLTVPFASP